MMAMATPLVPGEPPGAGRAFKRGRQRRVSRLLVDRDRAIIHLEHMRAVTDPKEFFKQLFKAGQQPAAWLRSAGHLRDAAEAILEHELPAERAYSQAFKIADEEADAESVRNDTGVGTAEIKASAPNYPPAQLLYAYAIENVLKGLIVFKRPDLIREDKLHGELQTHDLNKLAEKAKVTVDQQHERPVLEALTHLSTSAGRYPIALEPSDDTPNPNALLGYGSAHPIMRMFFERAYKELESRVPEQIPRFEKVFVFRESGGTS
jgi:hypothetical protein